MKKPKLFVKSLRCYSALKLDCNNRRNIGLIGGGEQHRGSGILNAKNPLCHLLRKNGEDFYSESGFVRSPRGKTHFGNGSGFVGWKDFGNRQAALRYLEKCFEVVHCDQSGSSHQSATTIADKRHRSQTTRSHLSAEYTPSNDVENLLRIGFQDVAQWRIETKRKIKDDGDDSEVWDALRKHKNALYAFCVGETVLYIGKTARSIDKRFIGYRDPGSKQVTNKKCHDKIRELTEARKTVRILVMPDQTSLQWGGYRINLAAGLEDALVEEIRPSLNGKPAKAPVTESERLEVEAEKD